MAQSSGAPESRRTVWRGIGMCQQTRRKPGFYGAASPQGRISLFERW